MVDRPGGARRSARLLRITRIPGQVLVMFGLTAGCYATSLAAVSGLQSASDSAVAEARGPYADGIGRLTDGHDLLENGLRALVDLDGRAVDANDRLSGEITGLEARLDRLSANVSAVDGAARVLPARAPMPVAVRSLAVSRSTSAHATTGGSAAP